MSRFASLLLEWYSGEHRDLPWRGATDPYAIWVSEIMLQQTRVVTVIPYFKRWMRRFPSIRSLAQASEREVLNFWEGLGYYSRARNLHLAAKVVLRQYGGELPSGAQSLRALPGIGRYTAGAISSLAFGLNEPVLDANARRVLARAFHMSLPADQPQGQRLLWELAAKNLPKGKAGEYNQALMDLGAGVCRPKKPACTACPLRQICKARKLGIQEHLPVLKPKKGIPHFDQIAAVIRKKDAVLLARRPSRGLLGGMWEFPNGRVTGDPVREFSKVLKKAYGVQVRRKDRLGVLKHTYTHFKVTVYAFRGELVARSSPGTEWVRLVQLDQYPMGKIDRQIAGLVRE
jgi:A/G-specific adenine glycosylase